MIGNGLLFSIINNFKGIDKELYVHSSIAVSESFNHTLNDEILKEKETIKNFIFPFFFYFTRFLHKLIDDQIKNLIVFHKDVLVLNISIVHMEQVQIENVLITNNIMV